MSTQHEGSQIDESRQTQTLPKVHLSNKLDCIAIWDVKIAMYANP